MLLRISLIVAILAGLAALYFSHFQVSTKITTLQADVQTAQTNEQQAKDAQSKAQADAKKAKQDLEVASKELTEKTATLETTTAKLSEQQKRADQVSEELTATTRERNEAQQQLAAFVATGVAVDQIRAQRDLIAKTSAERDAYVAENKILNRNLAQIKNRLAGYEEPNSEVVLPTGLKGKVLAVDPKYNFVIIDIGEKQGVLENGQMLVNRDGKLVAKVRVTKVESNRSVANVMTDWQQSDIMEGDQVLY